MKMKTTTGKAASAVTGLLLLAVLSAGGLSAQDAKPAAPPQLSDAEIAHAAVTANAIDIDAGRIAVKRAKNAAVKAFAETMIRDHTGVNAQASALASKLGVTPKDNAVSQSLRTGEIATKAAFAKVSGGAFDVAYMDHEIAYHRAVIDAVDTVLVPQTQNAELKALLTAVRPALVAHLEHAKSVRAGLK